VNRPPAHAGAQHDHRQQAAPKEVFGAWSSPLKHGTHTFQNDSAQISNAGCPSLARWISVAPTSQTRMIAAKESGDRGRLSSYTKATQGLPSTVAVRRRLQGANELATPAVEIDAHGLRAWPAELISRDPGGAETNHEGDGWRALRHGSSDHSARPCLMPCPTAPGGPRRRMAAPVGSARVRRRGTPCARFAFR